MANHHFYLLPLKAELANRSRSYGWHKALKA